MAGEASNFYQFFNEYYRVYKQEFKRDWDVKYHLLGVRAS